MVNICYNMFRMEKHVFINLSNDLETQHHGLKGCRSFDDAEMLAMFLHILGH